MVGGISGLVAAIELGARRGRFSHTSKLARITVNRVSLELNQSPGQKFRNEVKLQRNYLQPHTAPSVQACQDSKVGRDKSLTLSASKVHPRDSLLNRDPSISQKSAQSSTSEREKRVSEASFSVPRGSIESTTKQLLLFRSHFDSHPIPPHNLVLSSVGVLLLWFSWFSFNSSATHTISSGGAFLSAKICISTALAGASGGIGALILYIYLSGMSDVRPAVNGVLAGLVSITGGCHVMPIWACCLVGGVAGALYLVVADYIESKGIDDPLEAFAVHGSSGILGTIATGIFAQGDDRSPLTQVHGIIDGNLSQILYQFFGLIVICAWTVITAWVCVKVIDRLVGFRVSAQVEMDGLDYSMHGGHAYPTFVEKVGHPTGVVAIVHTDIQGSTDLWSWNPTVMYQASILHDSIMREAIFKHHGYEVTTEGDAFQIAFHHPIEAIQWCFDTQKRLLLADWPDALLSHPAAMMEVTASGILVYRGIRVRMAVDVGHVSCEIHPLTKRMR